MNLQTELLDNRTAELKVEIDADQLEKAKRKAARGLAGRVNIPGFRKGKAPYNIVARYLGEGAILEEAVDSLGPDTYRDALAESELEPYGPGQLENIEPLEDNQGLTFTFHVPLVPQVELGEYRAVRHDYETPEIEEKQVEDIIEMLRSNKATSEVKDGPAEMSDEVKIDVYGEFVAEETEEEAPAEAEEGDDPADTDDGPEIFVDQKDFTFVLGESFREPMGGFSEALVGMAAEDERSFDLTIADDDEDYDEPMRGRTVTFTVTCHEVSTREVPTLDDEFVQSLEEDDATTVEELRSKIFEDVENNAVNQAESEYADTVLDLMVEAATVEYPPLMVEEYIDDAIKQLEGQAKQQGIEIDMLLQFRQITMEDLREEYREAAITRLERSLVLGELVRAEELEVDERAINKAVKDRAKAMSYGNDELATQFETYLNAPQARQDISVEVLSQQAIERMMAIAKGEEPEVGPIPFVEEEEEEVPAAEAVVEETIAEGEEAPVAEETASDETVEEPAEEPAAEEDEPEAE